MTIQSLNSPAMRRGIILGKMLKRAYPVISLGTIGINDDFQRNQGETVKYRRVLPKGGTTTQPNRFFQDLTAVDRTQAYVATHLASEGVTPTAETVSVQDISATVVQYAVLYGYTDKMFDLGEDDYPAEMVKLVGERQGLVMEMALFGVLKACTNRFYGGTGTTRATVNGTISLTGLRKIAKSLNANHASTISRMMKRGKAGLYGTAPVGRCFPVWVSTDLMPDLRELPGFIPVEAYGAGDGFAVDNEVGKCEEFRFIASPELVAIQDAGAAIAGAVPALQSLTGTSADVYQVIIGSEDAWGHIGVNKDSMEVTSMSPKDKDKNDPLGQRGYVGCKFYYHAVILNNLQMAVYDVATRALTD
jgi:N4-gp56 family major capsid protein